MIDTDSILDLIENKSPSAVVPAMPKPKKHLTSAQVAQFLRDREAKGMSPVDRIPWVLRQMTRGLSFDGCGHKDCKLGVYVGVKYARPCFQCKGKGFQSDHDKLRNAKHQMAMDADVRKASYKQYDNPYMEQNL